MKLRLWLAVRALIVIYVASYALLFEVEGYAARSSNEWLGPRLRFSDGKYSDIGKIWFTTETSCLYWVYAPLNAIWNAAFSGG
jgi:hypothetical protein